jgi:putative membrane protein
MLKAFLLMFSLALFPLAGWSADSTKSTKLSKGDADFIREAAQGGIMEVQLGKIAQTKASDGKVKEFGKRMEQDHGKANEQLMKLAADKGMQLSNELDKRHKAKVDKLSKHSGAEFDRNYMDEMVTDHKADIKKFEQQSEKAKDADLKKFATETLPILKEHLRLAESTAKDIRATGKSSK